MLSRFISRMPTCFWHNQYPPTGTFMSALRSCPRGTPLPITFQKAGLRLCISVGSFHCIQEHLNVPSIQHEGPGSQYNTGFKAIYLLTRTSLMPSTTGQKSALFSAKVEAQSAQLHEYPRASLVVVVIFNSPCVDSLILKVTKTFSC